MSIILIWRWFLINLGCLRKNFWLIFLLFIDFFCFFLLLLTQNRTIKCSFSWFRLIFEAEIAIKNWPCASPMKGFFRLLRMRYFDRKLAFFMHFLDFFRCRNFFVRVNHYNIIWIFFNLIWCWAIRWCINIRL